MVITIKLTMSKITMAALTSSQDWSTPMTMGVPTTTIITNATRHQALSTTTNRITKISIPNPPL